MYNRYIRNDRGTYTRVPEDVPPDRPPPSRPEVRQESRASFQTESARESRPEETPRPGEAAPRSGGDPHSPPAPPPRGPRSNAEFPRNLFSRGQIHPDFPDAGDLLLLALLFLLVREHADEETLAAVGLLLIL